MKKVLVININNTVHIYHSKVEKWNWNRYIRRLNDIDWLIACRVTKNPTWYTDRFPFYTFPQSTSLWYKHHHAVLTHSRPHWLLQYNAIHAKNHSLCVKKRWIFRRFFLCFRTLVVSVSSLMFLSLFSQRLLDTDELSFIQCFAGYLWKWIYP